MKPTPLSAHTLKKGKFVTPINSLPSLNLLKDNESWFYGRLPEYLWIGLIFYAFDRQEGLKKLLDITVKLHEIAPAIKTLRMSEILKLEPKVQEKFYDFLLTIIPQKTLAPLTIYLTLTVAPVFTHHFFCNELHVSERCKIITETMNNLRDHQSHAATDIRYIVLCFSLISGTLRLKEEHFKKLEQYATLTHDDERMRSIRPFIRASELGILCLEKTNSHYLHTFWENLSQITSCEAFMVQFPEEKRDISIYMEKLHSIFRYLADLFTASRCLDEKMIVLLGIATYSYKRFKECYEHNLFNSISGRSCVRVLIEDLILMKYLVKNEQKHENIWRDYQSYGIGLYKLVLARHRETNLQTNSQNESHFDMEYIEALVNEYRNEEFIDMDTRYFDNQNIRLKAKDVNEKNLYGLYYDYDSSYEHGLWGAIRESSLLMCNNPAHKYHGIPDVEDRIRLKTVMPDCIMVMNKILEFLDEIYGIPNDLKEEVMDFESQLINR